MSHTDIVFGPVPSRRLGRSLGINHIPPKHCSYSCRYCQVGPTRQPEIVRHAFHPPELVGRQVAERIAMLRARGEAVDYLTLVPDGEPTLDIHLGEMIGGLRPLGLPIAVISNASLIWREDVRAELAKADWVSLKVDSIDAATWRALNQPHPQLQLAAILDGIRAFAASYRGTLASETMLVAGVNDDADGVEAVARFLAESGISLAYLAIPRRPPADPGVACPDATVVTRAWEQLSRRLKRVELLTAYEGDAFPPLAACRTLVVDSEKRPRRAHFLPDSRPHGCSMGQEAGEKGAVAVVSQPTIPKSDRLLDDPRAQLLAITAVHPMRESAARALLASAGADWSLAGELLASGALQRVEHGGEVFYLRRLRAD
jgi:wyosine [tRNA(Phe)-imidazoG37] synthetase (radical SAM superfamily)